MRKRGAILASIVILIAACSSPGSSSTIAPATASAESEASTATSASPPEASPGAVNLDPNVAALEAAGGQQLGGSVSMLGVLGGAELDAFLSVIKPFEEAVGTTLEYESTRDLSAVLQTRIDAGNPPNLVSTPSIGLIADLSAAGKVVDLSTFLDADALARDFDAGLLAAATENGHLFGIFDAANVGGLIWYNPNTYDGPTAPKTWQDLADWATETAETGTTPWCIGMESGPASGWPGANLITDIILRQSGPDAYDAWWQGSQAWSSAEIKQAFETFAVSFVDAKMVSGGKDAVLATPFTNGADGIFAAPPTCHLHPQANFMGSIINGNFPDLKPIEDVDFFAMPGFTENGAGIRQISGEIAVLTGDSPQGRALIAYLASPAAQALIAGTGNWLSANKSVPSSAYPSPYTAKAAQVLAEGSEVHYYGNALMPQAMSDAFWKAVLDYVADPSKLESILASLDAVQAEAYH